MKQEKRIKFNSVPPKCIYCGRDCGDFWLHVCKSCINLWNENWEKYMPVDEEYKKLENECEKYIKQAMTGHTCGQEACIGGGGQEWFCSSDCFGCFPDTQQHYRNASSMVIAWTENWVKSNIMKNILLKGKEAK